MSVFDKTSKVSKMCKYQMKFTQIRKRKNVRTAQKIDKNVTNLTVKCTKTRNLAVLTTKQ